MQVGIDSFAAAFDEGSRAVSPSDRLRQLVEQIVQADQVGLDVFGVGEHHRREFLDSAPAIILAAAAARTKRLRLTSAVTVLSAADPVRVFQSFATLDLLFPKVRRGRYPPQRGRGDEVDHGDSLTEHAPARTRGAIGMTTSRCLPGRRLSVEFVARRADRRPVRLQPGHQSMDRLHELLAQWRERVLDPRWHLRIDVTRKQAVALEVSQCRRQHPLRNPRDASLQLREPGSRCRPLLEHGDDEQAPLVTDPVQDFAKLAVVMRRQRGRRSGSSRHTVPSR